MTTDDRGKAGLAEALIDSDLIRRYSEYAIDAHEFTMAREGFDVLAEQWAAAILGERGVFWPTGTEEYRELIRQYQAEITLLRDIAADNEAEIGMLVAERDLAQVERDVAEAALRQIAVSPKAHKLVASICEIALAPPLDDIHGTPTFSG